jgi:putative membrane protein
VSSSRNARDTPEGGRPSTGSSPRQAAASSSEGNRRRARSERILGGGTEPDPRFTLANERTFLAWIRTALALLAGGIAVEAFTPHTFVPAVRTALAVFLLVLALVLALSAGIRWLRIERAMRRQAPLPLPLLVPVLASGGALVALAVIVAVLSGS